jgi:hypothetical protein
VHWYRDADWSRRASRSPFTYGSSEADNETVKGVDTGNPSEGWDDLDGANGIDLDALAKLGAPRPPRPESRVTAVMQRTRVQVLIWLVIAWEIVVVVEVLIRVANLPADTSSSNVTRLVVGGLGAAVAAAITLVAIRSKHRDHAEGTEPLTAWGVSWSTRWLFVGIGWMAIGMGLLFSAR